MTRRKPFTKRVRRGLAVLVIRGEASVEADNAYGHVSRGTMLDVRAALDWASSVDVFGEPER